MLKLINIAKDYYVDKKPFRALNYINLEFKQNEFCCILGPSGCGKTTLLNLIGGLDQYTSGDLIINNKSTKEYKDKDWDNYRNKRIGFVFQNYNLIPHLSIQQNIELALTLSGDKKEAREAKAKVALDLVGLEGIYKKRPNQLSGGQMQRVAIARALVNNPEIILADEPTGALDSKTSVQIMNILRKISETKLVIMVTHNAEIADKYATRVINLKDGVILKDFHTPLAKLQKEVVKQKDLIKDTTKKPKKKKSSMNFFTALNISLRNLMTKKGRTIITSIASSFGIIGVALVLALSSGFTEYIGKIESQSASSMPINIPSYSLSIEKPVEDNKNPEFPSDDLLRPYESAMGKPTYKYNSFSQKYVDYLEHLKTDKNLINEYLTTYQSNYSLNLTTLFPDETVKVVNNIDALSMNIGGAINSLTGLPTNTFHVLFGDENTLEDSYDTIYGTFPKKENIHEVALLVNNSNEIPLASLKALGIYSDTTTIEEAAKNPISFEDIVNKKYKVFTNDDIITTSVVNSLVDPTGNKRDIYASYYNGLTDKFNNQDNVGIELKITGVLRPTEGSYFASMAPGIGYQKGLEEKLYNANINSEIATKTKNNFILNGSNPMSLLVFFGDLVTAIGDPNNNSLDASVINNVINKHFSFYSIFDGSKVRDVKSYLRESNSVGIEYVDERLKEEGIEGLEDYLTDILKLFTEDNQKAYEMLISFFAYLNSYSNISSIIIFPKNLTSKKELISALDEFNKINTSEEYDPLHAQNEKEQVFYVDFVSSLSDGVANMINVISIVLVVFASISLVVSCVMTGIITYVSVIERTKEIGVLRALGARKKDVGRLFEAECFILGLLGGLIGCFAAFLITIPLNLILNLVFSEYLMGNIAVLNIFHVIALVLVSVLLSFISGFLPARMAAKKDPVTALRTE
ncbi:MAG TPA: ABC transporter ATP-binding protein/permease [Candidatus Onthovivens sp.]|nr:ABC transporter ATP-binding protein/permease [Candidatus Onthovivens sp.]